MREEAHQTDTLVKELGTLDGEAHMQRRKPGGDMKPKGYKNPFTGKENPVLKRYCDECKKTTWHENIMPNTSMCSECDELVDIGPFAFLLDDDDV